MLLQCGVGKQVAGQLLASELIERHVRMKRIDNIVPIGRLAYVLIAMKFNRVSVSNEV